MKIIKVTVVVVAYHGDAWLPDNIKSLQESGCFSAHLLLIDNSGNAIIDDLDLSQFDAEVLRTSQAMGFAEANNYALLNASHLEDVILFLNQDTISTDGWIDRCLDAFRMDERLGALSPFIRTYDGTGWDPSFMACIGPKDTWGEGEVIYRDHVPAPALLVRKEVLLETGPFDPVFGSYYEDYDLCRRIREAGYQIGFCRSAEIRHFSGSSTNNEMRRLKRVRQIMRNRVLFNVRKSRGNRLKVLGEQTLIQFPKNVLRSILRTPSSQPLTALLRAYFDLIKWTPRLVSKSYDDFQWEKYLKDVGWSSSVAKRMINENNTLYQ